MLRFLARCVALLCAVLFVPVAVATLFFHATGTRLPEAQTYKDTLDRAQFYTKAPSVLAETLSRGLEAGLANTGTGNAQEKELHRLLRELKPAEWESLLGAALPPALLRREFEGGLDQLFAFLHRDEAPPSMKISFVGLREAIRSPEMEETYLRLLRQKPAYTASLPVEAVPLSYNPTAEQLPAARENFRAIAALVASQIPESVDLLAELVNADRSGNTLAALNHSRHKLRDYANIARWSPVLPAALLLLVAAFGVRSLRGLLLWWGIPCMLSGAAAALLSLPTASATHWLFTHLILPQLPPQIPALTLDTVISLLTSAMEVVLNAVLHYSAWLGLGGFIAVLFSFLLRSRPADRSA